METAKEGHNFSSAYEHLLATVPIHRPHTEDEKCVVEYYCHEILRTITPLQLPNLLPRCYPDRTDQPQQHQVR